MSKLRSLFYPCAGTDIQVPIRHFADFVDSFWFVDTHEYRRGLPRLRMLDWEMINSVDRTVAGFASPVVTCRFKSTRIQKTLELNFVPQDGKQAFDALYRNDGSAYELAVFFHRGDSSGESGSDEYWLDRQTPDGLRHGYLREVLETIRSPGLVVTDGSNAIAELRKYFDSRAANTDAHRHVEPFQVERWHWEPISTLDIKYGPTIVWQVTSSLQ